MNKNTLIIFTGMSATGKTTLAGMLKEKYTNIKYLALDDFKESVYEQYGFCNDSERKVLWNLAKQMFQIALTKEMRESNIIIVDYAFDKSWNEFFENMSKTYRYKRVVVNFNTRDFESVWESRVNRDESSERPKCLTASAYIKDKLYVSNGKINDEYKEVKRKEYEEGKYTNIEGDIVISDKKLVNMLERDRYLMQVTFEDFINKRQVNDKYKEDAKIVFEYLAEPATVYKMITAIEMGITPLNAVCIPIEKLVDCSDIYFRQLVGREIKFILEKYGYKETNERERLRKPCSGKLFVTSSKYTKDNSFKGAYHFEVKVIE